MRGSGAGVLGLSRPSSPALFGALAAFGVMAAAQAPIPFVDDDRLFTVVVVAAFFATTCALATAPWGGYRATRAALIVVVVTFVLEKVGSSTGWPFGEYQYTDALQPQVAGVPVVVPLAWFAMAVPARQVAAALVRNPGARVALGAAALTAWDLMLDPQMVDEGYWTWAVDGPWRGIPLSNYAGWLLSSAGVMAALEWLLPPRRHGPALLALYTWWGASEALAFLVFLGDPVVGLVGGSAMLLPAGLAWRAELSERHET